MQYCHFTPPRGMSCICVPPPLVKRKTMIQRVNSKPSFIAFSLDDVDENVAPQAITAANELLILHTSPTHAEPQALENEIMPTMKQIKMEVLKNIMPFIVKNSPFKRSYKNKPKVLARLREQQLKMFKILAKRSSREMKKKVFNAFGYVPFEYDTEKWRAYKPFC